jgi:histone H3/H4
MRKLLTIMMALGLGVAAWVGLTRTRASAPGAPVSASDDTAQELATLKGEVASLKKIAVAQALRPALAAAADKPARTESAARHLPPAEQRRMVKEALEGRFDSEAADPRWSAGRVQVLRDTFAHSMPEMNVVAADCATTLCRVTVEHTDVENQDSLMEKISSADGVEAEILYLFDKEATPPRTTLYIARPGHTLPRPHS